MSECNTHRMCRWNTYCNDIVYMNYYLLHDHVRCNEKIWSGIYVPMIGMIGFFLMAGNRGHNWFLSNKDAHDLNHLWEFAEKADKEYNIYKNLAWLRSDNIVYNPPSTNNKTWDEYCGSDSDCDDGHGKCGIHSKCCRSTNDECWEGPFWNQVNRGCNHQESGMSCVSNCQCLSGTCTNNTCV